MPVWQQMYPEITAAGADLLSVAVDLQGAEKPRRYLETASASFKSAVDQTNLLAGLFGFKAVPNGMLIDEHGLLAYKRFGGFDIRKPETTDVVKMFLASNDLSDAPQAGSDGVRVASMDHFRRGLDQLRGGDRSRAVATWREGVALEPDNWLMRKQLWALEHPEKFYAGPVDFAWQKEQIAAGR
ncbi:MAG: hypothetical protein HY682_02435 [Chloroflexi bacterium]|nr:hypothetical protein [Chloroflexota bacterium]